MTNVKVCNLENVPSGSMKQFSVDEHEFLVVNHNGHLFCLDARCTHAGAPLAEGTLEGDILTCPWHRSQFNITDGTVIRGPAEERLHVYPNIVKDNFLFAEI